MASIIDALRSVEVVLLRQDRVHCAETIRDAIAEIERLRAEIVGGNEGRLDAFERAAQIAECFRCQPRDDWQPMVRERMERQNKVAQEIADIIRAEIPAPQDCGPECGNAQMSERTT